MTTTPTYTPAQAQARRQNQRNAADTLIRHTNTPTAALPLAALLQHLMHHGYRTTLHTHPDTHHYTATIQSQHNHHPTTTTDHHPTTAILYALHEHHGGNLNTGEYPE